MLPSVGDNQTKVDKVKVSKSEISIKNKKSKEIQNRIKRKFSLDVMKK